MRRSLSSPTAQPQRGAAALAVAMVLLFGMTLVLFFINRGLLFEQKTSANQYRSTRAFEVAEAGLEWATARLNDQRKMDDQCVAAVGQPMSFRERYAPRNAAFDFVPPLSARAGCRFEAGALACHCPPPGTAPNVGTTAAHPKFTVEIVDEPGDPEAVRVSSWACINQASACQPGPIGGGDATAVVRVTLKSRAVLRAAPVAALTVGNVADVGGARIRAGPGTRITIAGNECVSSVDATNSGFLVHAGAGVIGAATILSPPCGTPVENALVKDDGSLLALATADTTGDAIFQAFFGASLEQFQSAATTRVIDGGGAAANGSALLTDYALGHRSFFVVGDLLLGSGTSGSALGSASDPVTIVSSSNMTFNSSLTIHGLIVSAQQSWGAGGSSEVIGAVVAADNYVSGGTGTITHDPATLQTIRAGSAVMVRVPGSWRDFQ